MVKFPRKGTLVDVGMGVKRIVETIRSAAESIDPPACLALYGRWGSGKTTTLLELEKVWKARAAPAVWFDPWQYERHGDPLTPLVQALGRYALGDREDKRARARRAKVASAAVKTALSLSLRLGLAATAWATLGPAAAALSPLTSVKADDFEKYFESNSSDLEMYANAVEDIKTNFRDLVEATVKPFGAETRLLILLDDIDRCLPETAISIIEGVKLFLCGAPSCRVIFVLALDRGVIGEAVRQRYPGATHYTGENYLEKIFDLSFEVPMMEKEGLGKMVEANLQSKTSPGRLDLDVVRRVLGQPIFANPRTILRTLGKLALLEGSPDPEFPPRGDERHEKFVTYLAGAERYREFRDFLATASRDEFDAILGQTAAINLDPLSLRIANSAGFKTYMNLLGVNGYGAVPDLRALDAMLRRSGL